MSMQTSTDDSQRCRCRDCTGSRCPCCLASAAERGFALPADAIGDDMASGPYKDGYMLAVEQIAQLTADLAQATARADALAIENAELRAACVSLVEFSTATGWQRWECYLCLAESSSREQLVHAPDCLLAADPAQRGAELLAAAAAMREALVRLTPGPHIGATSGPESEEVRALKMWDRAQADLRGGRVTEDRQA